MFIGRKDELLKLETLITSSRSKFAVVKGRRRIGKSRLLQEFGSRSKQHKYFYFTSLAPEERITAQHEREYFASQLAKLFSIPLPPSNDWSDLLWTLADRLKLEKKSIVVFDEINWMGLQDPTFQGKLKSAWDTDFSQIPNLVLFVSGSLASWINRNILHHTGFVGRIDLDLTLGELQLADCIKFWGKRSTRISNYEKLQLLCITGGVPRYLEEINPKENAEQNIKRLCYDATGLLFREFEDLFADLFHDRNTSYRQIIEILADVPMDLEGLYNAMDVSKSGWISDRVDDLIACGFVARDYTWSLKNGKESKLSRLRVCDNYLRFYLKAIAPYSRKIMRGNFNNYPNIDSVLGLQFENLVLSNRSSIWSALGISAQNIVNDNPYFQRKTQRRQGCQIDYLIQLNRNTLYVCEIKFHSKPIGRSIIDEVQAKIDSMKMSSITNYRPVLICVNGVTDTVKDEDYFDEIIDVGTLFFDY